MLESNLQEDNPHLHQRATKFGLLDPEVEINDVKDQYPMHFKIMEAHNESLQKELENVTKVALLHLTSIDATPQHSVSLVLRS